MEKYIRAVSIWVFGNVPAMAYGAVTFGVPEMFFLWILVSMVGGVFLFLIGFIELESSTQDNTKQQWYNGSIKGN